MFSVRYRLAWVFLLALTGCEKSPVQKEPKKISLPDTIATHTQPASEVLSPHDYTAAFLAGLKPDYTPYSYLQHDDFWQKYATRTDNNWQQNLQARTGPMRLWRSNELSPHITATHTIFYPFSGPDFMNVHTFFPEAKCYILVGLEPIGKMPDLKKMDLFTLPSYLTYLEYSLQEIFKYSFFITKKMYVDLKYGKVNGTLPLLTYFLKRTGHTIVSISGIRPDENGAETTFPYDTLSTAVRKPVGVRIIYTDSLKEEKELIYFSTDLSNASFNTSCLFYKWLANRSFDISYMKSASYLMHYDNFTHIRDLVMRKSSHILQDDTGIRFRDFDNHTWNIQFYGEYMAPQRPFTTQQFQKELWEIYTIDSLAKPLPFELGYNATRQKSCLLLFSKSAKHTE